MSKHESHTGKTYTREEARKGCGNCFMQDCQWPECMPASAGNPVQAVARKCAQCKRVYKHGPSSLGCPKCAPGVRIAEAEFRKPIDAASQPPAAARQPREAVERLVHLRTDRARRVYVAGPMTGLPEFNFPAFNAASAGLRADGWHVENPAEHGHVEGATWEDYLRYDLSRLATCGAIYLLPGWENSKGAQLEVHVARKLGMVLMYAPGAKALHGGA